MKCKNCNNDINESNLSKEHIIHQAIGGLLESSKIYCKECNSKFGSNFDSRFAKIFAPITQNINIKTSRKKSFVQYNAFVKDMNGESYIGNYKGNKLLSIHSLFNNKFIEKVKGIRANDFTFYEIELDIYNEDFYNGLIKIAENYAIENGIEISDLIENL